MLSGTNHWTFLWIGIQTYGLRIRYCVDGRCRYVHSPFSRLPVAKYMPHIVQVCYSIYFSLQGLCALLVCTANMIQQHFLCTSCALLVHFFCTMLALYLKAWDFAWLTWVSPSPSLGCSTGWAIKPFSSIFH